MLSHMNYNLVLPVEALVPINPHKIPSYYVASSLLSDQRIQKNDFNQPLINLESSFEYLYRYSL